MQFLGMPTNFNLELHLPQSRITITVLHC